ncbi:hypothetical protein ScPMuIL_016809 [Solemya velum]
MASGGENPHDLKPCDYGKMVDLLKSKDFVVFTKQEFEEYEKATNMSIALTDKSLNFQKPLFSQPSSSAIRKSLREIRAVEQEINTNLKHQKTEKKSNKAQHQPLQLSTDGKKLDDLVDQMKELLD